MKVLQENRLSAFVEWEGSRAWIDRRGLLQGKTTIEPIAEDKLATRVAFQKPLGTGSTREVTAPAGSQVAILDTYETHSLVRYREVCGWIPNSSFGGTTALAGKVSALSDGFSFGPTATPEPVPSRLSPELVYETLVPFEIFARITSLRHYNVKPPRNGYNTGSTSWADFNLAWGPLLMDRSITSRQGHRRSSFTIRSQLPKDVDPFDYCHNFHIVCDSEALKSQILAAKSDDFVTLTGALVRVSGDPARFPKPAAWTSSIAGKYCYVLLVEEMVNHGKAPPPES